MNTTRSRMLVVRHPEVASKSPEQAAMEPLLLTVPQVCQKLQLGESMVRKLIRMGELGHLRVGRLLFVPFEALNTYITTNTRY